MQKDKVASLSLVIAFLVCLYAAAYLGHSENAKAGVIIAPISLLIPLALIWFGDELGESTRLAPPPVRKSPGWMVKAFGWLFLLGLIGLFLASLLNGSPGHRPVH